MMWGMAAAILIAGLSIGALTGVGAWLKWRDWQVAYAMSKGGGTFTWGGINPGDQNSLIVELPTAELLDTTP